MNDNPPAGLIAAVRPGSPAAQAGIRPGDRLLTIAGREPRDAVDVWFLEADEEVSATFLRAGSGEEDAIIFEKSPDEDLGLEFAEATWDGIRLCNNNCFFCFLKGLPRGMRPPLYLKDDDYRLSFLHGNFITLTNLREADWVRLEEQRLSPLSVSVHATDLALRRRMLSNPEAPDILAQLRRLGTLDIRVHTQVVVTPGVNDGQQLERTLCDLANLYPTVQTVSVVPVAASPRLQERALRRDGISLDPPDPSYARRIVALVGRQQRDCRRQHDKDIVHCSDEYYLTAGTRIPSARSYDGFPQFENGVGMVRSLLESWRRVRRRLQRRPLDLRGRRAVIGTGTLAAPVLRTLAAELADLTGARLDVVSVVNRRFGERVSVAGLICGEDFAVSLRRAPADLYVLPRPSLDYYGLHFLDDMTPSALADWLGSPVAFALDAEELVLALAGDAPASPARARRSNGATWSIPSATAAVRRGG